MIHPPRVQLMPLESLRLLDPKVLNESYVSLGSVRLDPDQNIPKEKHLIIKYEDFIFARDTGLNHNVNAIYLDSNNYITLN